MAIPFINALPEAPQRTDARPNFALRADVFFAAIDPMRYQMNTLASWFENRASGVDQLVDDAEQIKTDTQAIYEDTVGVKNQTEQIKTETGLIRDNATIEANRSRDEADRSRDEADRAEQLKQDVINVIEAFDPTGENPTTTVPNAALVHDETTGGLVFTEKGLKSLAFEDVSLLTDSIESARFPRPKPEQQTINPEFGGIYPANTSVTGVTINAPASSSNGDWFTVFDPNGSWSRTPPLFKRSQGQTIMGVNEDMELNVNNVSVTFMFYQNDWRAV